MPLKNPSLLSLNSITVESLPLPFASDPDVTVDVLRLDKIHPVISGNKWFKLKRYINYALDKKYEGIVTAGGAWSNHLIAAAAAAKAFGLSSTGIVRGEQPKTLSNTLEAAMLYGMQLRFVSRTAYRCLTDQNNVTALTEHLTRTCFIPEGGAGENGILGISEILSLVDTTGYSHIVCAVGTGTMLRGLVHAADKHQQVIGIYVLKGISDPPAALSISIDGRLPGKYALFSDYHFGGYAKKTRQLIEFMNWFFEITAVPTDFVYTGKTFFALNDLLRRRYFPRGSKILAIHSGGLQGNTSLEKGELVY